MSKLSSQEEKMLNLQYQMKQNNHDLQNFLQDLDNWESEIKHKESTLKDKKGSKDTALPPVRNSLDKKKLRKKVKKKAEEGKPRRISSYDYRSWDKFDVDKACDDVDQGRETGSSSGEYETDEEGETERKKQAATLEKDKGNEYFKKGDYCRAIECYTKGTELDPTNPLLPANRAMALLKQDKYAAAELDCSVALSLDPLYTKAYLRRGTAKLGLKKYAEAKSDYEKVLQLEPQNKKAKSDLELIEKEVRKQKMVSHADVSGDSIRPLGLVAPITKPPELRSKKPLHRIEIEEVGLDDDSARQTAMSKTLSAQSEAKKTMVERDQVDFQRFTANSPGDIAQAIAQPVLEGDKRENVPRKPLIIETVSNNSAESLKPSDADKNYPINTSVKITSSRTCVQTSEDSSNLKKGGAKDSAKKSNVRTDGTVKKPTVNEGTVLNVGYTSPRGTTELGLPTTSVQFQADYRLLKKDTEAFYQYFKKIPPSEYVKLFGQFFDADVLTTILSAIQTCYIRDGEDVWSCLVELSSVKRFSMVTMFLSSRDKQVLKEVFAHIRSSGKHSDEDVSRLSAKYDIE